MKICIATGTRAEYGLLKPLIERIQSEALWQLQLLVTGAHLSPEFGLTYKQIEADGYTIDAKVEMLLSSDTAEGIVKSMGLGTIGYADAFKTLQPDLLVILGDRYEMLAVASAALIFKIPIAHIHGGEITEGAFDDAIRHAITKMSHIHFAATETYRNRIIQLGENPERVFNVGAIGLDNIHDLPLLNRQELEQQLGITFLERNYLVTFHPATMASVSAGLQFEALLKAVDRQENSFFIFTKANSDTEGRTINKMIDEYVAQRPGKAVAYTSMGQLRYLSAMQLVDAVVGNSSSGIIEAPSFHKATINIGDRQKGRIQAETTINTGVSADEIDAAFRTLTTPSFAGKLAAATNPYGEGHSAGKIIDALKLADWGSLIHKTFYNIDNV
ncbi:UDP-N-acetylglucosamine 2-epimerase [Taibaiella chishuiensis]|uniref:GDP/UDP-N,N'-diacetylbacillosamine 2-epimerase (Hydrolysing) n=1 Tax=Taibaiella chishuiensis TaxID=1434707 RepID=A0A2P8DB44_9BACT|nr:UDP-N-acetylglucosamine 2-epimerase [Taibaiella chishuiensis]PSK94446.1 GDP/UDP-N,N'-diacetylbacillosamine 2-epimerase (hydrolysing) [Taibaiella chishuiensis]